MNPLVRQVQYSYDTAANPEIVLPKVYRMAEESILSPSGETWVSQGHAQYVHDEAGNRLSRTVSNVAALANQTLQYDNLDRVDANTLKTDANSWYDANGNTVARGTTDVYDAENRLITRGNISIAYDHEGNRVRKTVNGVTTLYLVDTLNPTGYAQVIAEFASGTSDALKVYAYGNDLISMRLPQQGPTGTVYYYGYDGHGSVRMLFDESNAEIESYDYDAYGTIIAQTTAPVENVYLYSGEQWDPDLGMYYLRARYYDEGEGRFWTMDSYEGTTSDPASLHKYLYCADDPLNRIDPSGQFSVSETLSVQSITRVLQTGVGHLGTAFRIYRQADAVIDFYQSLQFGRRVLQAFMQTTPEGVQAALLSEIRSAFGDGDVSQIMNGFGEAFRMVGPRWPEIAQAIRAKAPTIAAEATAAAKPHITSFSKAASQGNARFVLYLPTAPGERAGLNNNGKDTYMPVNKQLMVAAGITGGRLFGFGIRDFKNPHKINHQLFRIDYYDQNQSNPLYIHYHILNDRRHELIWKP